MAAFEDVRRIALGLPETEEVVTWGSDLTFRVKGKIYAITGEGADRVSIKATPSGQAELIELDPETYSVAAYVGRFGWVVVVLERVDPARLESLLRDAWRLTAPKPRRRPRGQPRIVEQPAAGTTDGHDDGNRGQS